jgi:NAD(P)-dependent dehydrogenase (short-subunit alcohol dehydrogenase family)
MGKLNGKVAIVTGASRGIGEAIARLFAAEGARVACAARSLKEGDHRLFSGSLETTVAGIEKAGGQALAIQTDLSSEESCRRLVARTREAFGLVDILVNNAAVSYFLPIKDLSSKQWDTSWAVGPRAMFVLTREVLPDMMKKRGGAIVNVSSVAAIGPGRGPYKSAPQRGGTLYGAEKAAIERYSQGLAEEVYEYGISVSSLAPSQVVPTPGTVYFKMVSSLDDPRGEPPEMMARASLLLVSEPQHKVTGRVTYSQQILKEFGWIKDGQGAGVTTPGSDFSKM